MQELNALGPVSTNASPYQLPNLTRKDARVGDYLVIKPTTTQFRGKLALVGLAKSRQREILLFDTDAEYFKNIYQSLREKLPSSSKQLNLIEILNCVVQFVAAEFANGMDQRVIHSILDNADNKKVTNIFSEEVPLIFLEEFLDKKVGAPRHAALLTACLIDQLAQDKILPSDNIQINIFSNHTIYGHTSWVNCNIYGNLFLLDPLYYPNKALILASTDSFRAYANISSASSASTEEAPQSPGSSWGDRNDLEAARAAYGEKLIKNLREYYNINYNNDTTIQDRKLDLNIDPYADTDNVKEQPENIKRTCELKFSILKEKVIQIIKNNIKELEADIGHITNQKYAPHVQALNNLMIQIESNYYQYDDSHYNLSQNILQLIKKNFLLEENYSSNDSVIKNSIQAIQEMEEDFLHDILTYSLAYWIQKISSSLETHRKKLESELSNKVVAFFSSRIKQDKIDGIRSIITTLKNQFPNGALPQANMPTIQVIIKEAIANDALETRIQKGKYFHFGRTRKILEEAMEQWETFREKVFPPVSIQAAPSSPQPI